MLDGILTTALQIIIVLDICGAVLYFLMSGASRAKEAKASAHSPTPRGSQEPQFAMSTQLQPAMAGAGAVEPPPVPEWVSRGDDRSASAIYGVEGVETAAPERAGWSARIGGMFSSLKGRFGRQKTQENGESADDLNVDHTRLNRVLDSFREEM